MLVEFLLRRWLQVRYAEPLTSAVVYDKLVKLSPPSANPIAPQRRIRGGGVGGRGVQPGNHPVRLQYLPFILGLCNEVCLMILLPPCPPPPLFVGRGRRRGQPSLPLNLRSTDSK